MDERKDKGSRESNLGEDTAKPPVTPAAKPPVEQQKPDEPAKLDTSIRARIERGVEAWVASRMRGSLMSRHTESWNLLQARLPDLTDLIEKELQA